MLPAKGDAAPSQWRGDLIAIVTLRRRVAMQSTVDAAEGVKARRVLFSPGKPSGDMLAALEALDNFERAIVEDENRLVIEARRRRCLAVLDRLVGG